MDQITPIANAVAFDHMWNLGWGHMVFWMVVVVTVFVGVVAIAFTATRQPEDLYRGAHQVLAEMYAKGEIDDEEFQRRRQTLGS